MTELSSPSPIADLRAAVGEQVGKVVIGQAATVDLLTMALLVGGHVLLEGPPGTAKTLLASAFSRSLSLEFRRAQFTPDMLPTDLTGTMTLRGGELAFRPGPIFTNVLLADEINRTPPKTQAALLEAMQEAMVSVDGTSHPLPQPFLVIATQNPIEYEGTYPLPEAQLDRFLVKVPVNYPTEDEEIVLLHQARHGLTPAGLDRVDAVLDGAAVLHARSQVDATSITDEVIGYITQIIRRTRDLPSVAIGASPRAGVHLLVIAKATACLRGRNYVTPDDVVDVAGAVLGHRLVLRPEAELDGMTPRQAIDLALKSVAVPR